MISLSALVGCTGPGGVATVCGERFEFPWSEPRGTAVSLRELRLESLLRPAQGLGSPTAIARGEDGTLTFAYRTSAGEFWISERATDRTQLPGVVPLCGGREELTLRGEIPAVLIWGESTRYLTWFEGGLRIQVMGDSVELTREEVLELAAHVPP